MCVLTYSAHLSRSVGFGHPCSYDTLKELELGFPGFYIFSNKILTEYSPSLFFFFSLLFRL